MRATILQKIVQQAFPGMPDAEAQELISIGEVHSYPPGTTLCREGMIERIFYIVLEGEVTVSKTINESEARVLKPLHPGDFFGEYALIHDAPRTATVRTSRPSTLLEIHKKAFDDLLDRSPSVSKAMVREVSRRLRENDELALEDLRLKASELASAYQRLAEMDFARREFLTTIAHELRTPLTSANGFLQFIRQGALQGEMLQDALDTVARNIQRIITLSNDILFLQEMDLILKEPQPVDIGSLVFHAVHRKQDWAKSSKVQMYFEVQAESYGKAASDGSVNPTGQPDKPLVVMGDAESLERAIDAILENAIKFSPDGGNVYVKTWQQGTAVYITIQDQGVGIPEESLPRIFDRFFHLERIGGHLFGGLGLGLSIASQVVEQHGGNIVAQSKLGEGSTFTVMLPISGKVPAGQD